MKLKQILEGGITLSSGAQIFSVVGLPAEVTATLHALNSREPGGFTSNLPKMFEDDGEAVIERVLQRFYVGYGHKSIGDCGDADIFIDGVSMLVPNAFEHWPLFNGQETSSRFVDVTVNGFHVPGGMIASASEWCERWLEFYKDVQPALVEMIRENNPKTDDQSQAAWEKATNARSFDIAGAFLPCGAKTNFSEVINLRQWSDQVQILVHHPLEEVRETAKTVLKLLQRDHPNSFKISEREERERYMEAVAGHLFGGDYQLRSIPEFEATAELSSDWEDTLSQEFLELRPPGCDLPFDSAKIGRFRVRSVVDYRSFRDLHRHRGVTWKMPIVDPSLGFEPWYLDQLPAEYRQAAEQQIEAYTRWYRECQDSRHDKQYTTPMGFKVPVNVTAPFPSVVYIAELRSGLAVHPTARRWALNLASAIREAMPDFKLHVCEDPDRFVPERGKHDIVKKD